ncbi:MAG: hypothetical protein Q9191_001302 [Dirinaria sp. TL-2023a]
MPRTSFLSTVSTAFDSCIPTPLAFLSTLLGVLSILSWLCAQLPQIIKNYTLGSASGLSAYFLAEWLLGDATNLLGALLTKQATWQVVIAAYYVTVDVILVYQYLWYSHIKPWQQTTLIVDTERDSGERDGDSSDTLVSLPQNNNAKLSGNAPEPEDKAKRSTGAPPAKPDRAQPSKSSGLLSEKDIPNSSHQSIPSSHNSLSPFHPSPKSLLLVTTLCVTLAHASPLHATEESAAPIRSLTSGVEGAGRLLSWISTLCYLGSRLPQIYKNARRRSTAGLSPVLFIAAFFGNLFYSSSLLTNPLAWASYPPYGLDGWAGPEGSDRATWVSLAAPFWLGAAGVLALDATVGVQFLLYGEERKVVVVMDDRGRGRWRRVSGWMRGWIPSPRPARLRSREDERSLLTRDNRDQITYGAA